MQLAASQRAHPPPVPPRPSRQLVQEALKKSPRPPCPTRQAPPPPNHKPWRLDQARPGCGRTIVYNSAADKPRPDSNGQAGPEPAKGQQQQPDKRSVSFAGEKRGEEQAEGQAEVPGEKLATVVVIDECARIDSSASSCGSQEDNIHTQDWLEAGVKYSSTKITLPADQPAPGPDQPLGFAHLDFSSIIERIAMSSLQGLPPLPRSLSGFNLNGAGLTVEPPPPPSRSSSRSQRAPKTPSTTSLSSQGSRPSPQGRQLTTLDTQLAILRREMFGLRQLDLSLLSQLWSLNESIQEFRQLLQEQEERAPSPSPSSDEGDDASYGGGGPAPSQPPPPPRRPPAFARPPPPRIPRTAKLPPSDESPSSEEYGAV